MLWLYTGTGKCWWRNECHRPPELATAVYEMANCGTERGGLGKAKRFLLLNKISTYFGEKVCQFILFLVSNNNELYTKLPKRRKVADGSCDPTHPSVYGPVDDAIAVRSSMAKVWVYGFGLGLRLRLVVGNNPCYDGPKSLTVVVKL